MKLSEFRNQLNAITALTFIKPDGENVPAHFHITEVGEIQKRFIDCGGTIRTENAITMQLWESIDVWHRLSPEKLAKIIDLSKEKLSIGDFEVEIEYQSDTIGRYSLDFEDGVFRMKPKNTTCLASDQCGIPSVEQVKEKVKSCCTPGGGCC